MLEISGTFVLREDDLHSHEWAVPAVTCVLLYGDWQALVLLLCVPTEPLLLCVNSRDAAFQHSTAGEGLDRCPQREATRGQQRTAILGESANN